VSQDLSDRQEADVADATTLREQRDTLKAWMARLEAQREDVSPRVVERVRADYEERLRRVLESLAEHREAIEDEFDRVTAAIAVAEEEHAHAIDRLEEGRLRNSIGELSDAAWYRDQASLEERVKRSAAREAEAKEEAIRLRDILDQLADRGLEEQQRKDVEPLRGSSAVLEVEEVEYVEDIEDVEENPEVTVESRPISPAPSPMNSVSRPAPFLADIDRALADELGGKDEKKVTVARIPSNNPEPSFEETAPKPGLKCGECGYTNDLSVWYCGVCGADVG
jgi:chromosome segregation ATPase